jgi:hypothetical protein
LIFTQVRYKRQTELLDAFTENANDEAFELISGNTEVEPDVLGIREAVFSWSNKTDGSITPSTRPFHLHVDELIFKPGCINLIVGPTGSGKTSLLMALLG